MFQKCFVVLVLMVVTIIAQESESYLKNQQIVPVVFSVMDSKNDLNNPNSDVTTNFHITLFSGKVKSVLGIQLGVISNNVLDDFFGYDATGIYSRTGGNYSGYQTVGLVGRVEGSFTGIQESGIYSYVGKDFLGIQTTGVMGKVEGNFQGGQFSGLINETNDITGVQFSGIVNKASDVEGAQFAGIINSAKDIVGVQSAGIFNNAEHVKGVQIGLINHSTKLDGIALGLINLSDEGRIHAVGWAGGISKYQVGIKFAPNDYWYTILSFGDIQNDDQMGDKYLIQSRMGLHYAVLPVLYMEADLGSGTAFPHNLDNWKDSENFWQILEARMALGFKFGSRLSVFGGISTNYAGQFEELDDNIKGKITPFFGIQF